MDDAHVDHAGEDAIGDPGRQRGGRRPGVERVVEHGLLHVQQRRVQRELRGGMRILLGQLGRAPAALGPGRLAGQGLRRHQTFSMLTRNALNSGVLEFASPTNGVSALASQFAPLVGSRSAEMPTKPQWIGMPIW